MIIDTMVMAYALLGVPGYAEESAEALRTADELVAPASVEAELLNVVWQWGQSGVPPTLAATVYGDATRLWTELLPVEDLWPPALALAFERKHSPYDTLFIAAARQRKTRLLTYDKKLLRLFPEETTTVKEFLR